MRQRSFYDPVMRDLDIQVQDDKTLSPAATKRLRDGLERADYALQGRNPSLLAQAEVNAALVHQLTQGLMPFVGETGQSEGAGEVLDRLIAELRGYRDLSDQRRPTQDSSRDQSQRSDGGAGAGVTAGGKRAAGSRG